MFKINDFYFHLMLEKEEQIKLKISRRTEISELEIG